MTQHRIDQILADYEAVHPASADAELEAVAAAIFLEDVFGVELTDADLTPEALGTVAAMRATLARRGVR